MPKISEVVSEDVPILSSPPGLCSIGKSLGPPDNTWDLQSWVTGQQPDGYVGDLGLSEEGFEWIYCEHGVLDQPSWRNEPARAPCRLPR